MHEFLRLGGDGRVFVQGPGKVPLRLPALSDCVAVHNGLQVGINPGSNDEIWIIQVHTTQYNTASMIDRRGLRLREVGLNVPP